MLKVRCLLLLSMPLFAQNTGKPIEFTLPTDAYVSLNIKNSKGKVVCQLLKSKKLKKGANKIYWDGLTTLTCKRPGITVPAGNYSWEAIYHTGIGVRMRGWAYHGPSDPWDTSPTSYWGGDHGLPYSVDADDKQVYLGWSGAEAGKALIAMDLDGNVLWAAGFHFNSAGLIASDPTKEMVYYISNATLKRVSSKNGKPVAWPGRKNGDMPIKAIWKKPGGPARMDYGAGGFDAYKGKLYMSFSGWSWQESDVINWHRFLTRIVEDKGGIAGRLIWASIDKKRSRGIIKKWLASGQTSNKSRILAFKSPHYLIPEVHKVIVSALRKTTFTIDFPSTDEPMTKEQVAENNRKYVEKCFPGDIAQARSNLLVILDSDTGKEIKSIPLLAPGRLAVVNEELIYIFVDRTKLYALNPKTGKKRLVMKNLKNNGDICVDKEGNIYISYGSPFFQIKQYDSEGTIMMKIGKAGGRTRKGLWEPHGLGRAWGIAVDARGKLWAAETELIPKRMSVWDPETGEFVKEFFGPTHYGASGGAINPWDPDLMVGEGCEFRIDPKTGRAKMLGIFNHQYPHSSARFCQPANKRLYLAALFKRKKTPEIGLFERLSDAKYAMRGMIRPIAKQNKTLFWADKNGNHRSEPNEVQTFPLTLGLGGYNYWSMNMNTDLTFYGTHKDATYQFKVASFTECGAPVYDLKNVKKLPKMTGALSTPDNTKVLSTDAGKAVFTCYDTESGEELWTYPNEHHGVHGSHYAPGWKRGRILGAFGPVGTATLPKPLGQIWA
ncbi:MAG: hypothetical protein HRT89_18760, partial [Lentisphaeria bacterium]|nr:hypothetical protein [Lentisphaeria bacterium]